MSQLATERMIHGNDNGLLSELSSPDVSQPLASYPMGDLVKSLQNSKQFKVVISCPFPHLEPHPLSAPGGIGGLSSLSAVIVDLPLCRIGQWTDHLPPTWGADIDLSIQDYAWIKSCWPSGVKRLKTTKLGEYYFCRIWCWVRFCYLFNLSVLGSS